MSVEDIPVLDSFRIVGLHGYKDLSIEFHGPARIIIAENGAGKTTILSALNAFLRADFDKFRGLSFDSMECHFHGSEKPLVLRRAHIPSVGDPNSESRIQEWARFVGEEADEVRRAILSLDEKDFSNFRSEPVLESIYYNSPLNAEEMIAGIRSIRADLDRNRSDELKILTQHIKEKVSGYEVLYLPTYRRVELPLAPREVARVLRRVQHMPPHLERQRLNQRSRSRGHQYPIQFGLADVEERLNEISSQIQRESSLGYRVISANIIDELLAAGRLAGVPGEASLPDIEALSLFFSRIGAAPVSSRSAERIDAIKALYDSGDIYQDAYDDLRYFLAKLSRVVDQTKGLEKNIETFVEKVNDYFKTSADEKLLVYDATRMKVKVQNLWTQEKVKFDDLSSGEKQVVSILAHLYLYTEKKIVLIDEPELSLSMDWQKRLLPDVINSPTCAQLLAITHSPFIFDNALDPFAGPLSIERRRKQGE